MFDVGFWELALIGVVALIIVGPERLPGVVRTAGRWAGQARRIVREAKADLEREMKAHDIEALHDLKSDVQNAGREFKRAAGDIDSAVDAARPGKFGEELRETLRQAAPGAGQAGGEASSTVNSTAADATVNATAGDSTVDAAAAPGNSGDSTVTDTGTVTDAAADAIADVAAGAGDHYIYQSRGRAVLHVAHCTYCDHGRGRNGRGAGPGASWHGPYSSRAAAERAQQGMTAALKKVCGCVARPAAAESTVTAAAQSTVTTAAAPATPASTATVAKPPPTVAKPPPTVAAESTAAESP